MTQQSWSQGQAAVVGQEIKRLRGKRSAQWVADRTEDLGYAVSRSTIADLEIGRRKHVLVTELVAVAAALDTAPLELLYPPTAIIEVEALPGVHTPVLRAARWFASEGPLGNSAEAVDRFDSTSTALALLRRHDELATDLDHWLSVFADTHESYKTIEKGATSIEDRMNLDASMLKVSMVASDLVQVRSRLTHQEIPLPPAVENLEELAEMYHERKQLAAKRQS